MHARSVVRAWGLVAPRAGPSTAFARTLSSSAGTYNAPMNAMGKVLDQIAVDKSSSLTRAEPPKTPADAAAVEGRPTTPNQDANTTAGTAESETAGVKTGLPRRGRVGTPGYAPDVRPPVVDPVIDLFINMIMLHGKKSQARKEMSNILENIRLTTMQDPIPILKQAVTMASPSIRLMMHKHSNKSTPIPVALDARQRTHGGIRSILKATAKSRKNPAPRHQIIAKEIMEIIAGRSAALQAKEQLHKAGAVARSNMVLL